MAAARPVRAARDGRARRVRHRRRAVEAFARRHRLRPLRGVALGGGGRRPISSFPTIWPWARRSWPRSCSRLSLDLILGYAGIVTLGPCRVFRHRRLCRRLLAAHGWSEPIVGLLVAGAGRRRCVGFLTGLVVLRTQGLTLLMLTLVVAVMLQEAANKATSITGGADGLQGMEVAADPRRLPLRPLRQHRLFLLPRRAVRRAGCVARRIVHSPFGRSLTGIRENEARMHAIGSPVFRGRLTIYTISAAMAGVAGALHRRRRRSSSRSMC